MPAFNHHLSQIDEALFGLKYPSAPYLSEKIGVGVTQVYRLLAELRDHHGLEIPHDKHRGGYYFERWPQQPYSFEFFGEGVPGIIAKVSYAMAFGFTLDLCTSDCKILEGCLPAELVNRELGTVLVLNQPPEKKLERLSLKGLTVLGAKPFGGCSGTYWRNFGK